MSALTEGQKEQIIYAVVDDLPHEDFAEQAQQAGRFTCSNCREPEFTAIVSVEQK